MSFTTAVLASFTAEGNPGPRGCRRDAAATVRGSGHDLDGIADAHLVEVPCGVVRAQVDASVTDVGVALRVNRPGGRVHVDAAVSDPHRVRRGDFVSLG